MFRRKGAVPKKAVGEIGAEATEGRGGLPFC